MEIERAIEVLRTYNNCKSVLTEELEDAIDLAISALEKQVNGGWIPVNKVNKEYPKFDENCLAQTQDGYISTSIFYGFGEERQGYKEFLNGVWEINELDKEVIAWQPLPEPYKEV